MKMQYGKFLAYGAMLAFIFLPCLSLASELPNGVAQALGSSRDWLSSFDDKTENEIIKILGEPASRNSWDLNGQKQNLLEYKYEKYAATLQLYFLGNRVASISLLQNSK